MALTPLCEPEWEGLRNFSLALVSRVGNTNIGALATTVPIISNGQCPIISRTALYHHRFSFMVKYAMAYELKFLKVISGFNLNIVGVIERKVVPPQDVEVFLRYSATRIGISISASA